MAKTLAERLKALAERVEYNVTRDWPIELAELPEELRALVAEVEGKVLVKPSVIEGLVGGTYLATLLAMHLDAEGEGNSPMEARANLQKALSQT